MTFCGCLLSRSLSGAKRTYLFAPHMSAFDPKRTSLHAPPLASATRLSAPAGPIDWASAIDGTAASRFAVFADCLISHRCHNARPKNDTRSRDATRGIINVLTVHNRRACGLYICSRRQNQNCKKGKQCYRSFHVQLHLLWKILEVISNHLLIWLKKSFFRTGVTLGGEGPHPDQKHKCRREKKR